VVVPRLLGIFKWISASLQSICGGSSSSLSLLAPCAQPAPLASHGGRSCATGVGERLGVAPHIVEAILNHASGHKKGIAGIYNRATYEKEKRAALCLWASHVLAAVEGRAANIVSMR
jgi:hypothetical protein